MIGRMNNDWALQQLDEFITLTTLYQPPPTPGVIFLGDDRRTRGSEEQIVASAQVVEQVLTHVLPRWRQEIKATLPAAGNSITRPPDVP